jgi:predicted permease
MRLFRKLQHLLGRRARLRRLEEEMRTHLELLIEEGERSGLPPEEARRRAQLAFGNTLATREGVTDVLGWPVLESVWQDLCQSARSLYRRPLFTLSLVAVLALGIGGTGSIVSLVRSVLLAPLPVPHPEEIYVVRAINGRPQLLSAPTLQRLASAATFRGGIAGYSYICRVALGADEQPVEPVAAQFVTADFFQTLGVPAAHGRTITVADDRLGEPAAVAVVSWEFWRSRLGGDPSVVGRTVRLNGLPVAIVGVAPERFRGVSLGDEADFWLPLGLHAPLRASPANWTISDGPVVLAERVRDDRVAWLNLLLRLPAGCQADAAGALAAAWQPQCDRVTAILDNPQDRAEYARRAPRIVPAPQGYSDLRNGFRSTGLTLSLLVAAVVLVATANSAALLLLRLLSRTRELGVRLALGVGRWRLARGFVMEGLMLSSAGALVGLLLACGLTPLLAEWLVPGAVEGVGVVDGGLVGLLAVLAVVLGLVVGGVPAWFGARIAPQAVLQRQFGGPRGSLRFGRALIVLQLALSVVLIAVAGALALDLRRTLQANCGYARESVVTAQFSFASAGIEAARQPAVLERLRTAAQKLPQVQAVGFAACGPLGGGRMSSRIHIRGAGVRQPTENTQHENIDPEYFAALGTTLLQGRVFGPSDTAGSPRVALISQRLSREVFGGADPVGRRFGFGAEASDEDWEIVGVVADARVNSVREEPPALIYTPLTQWREVAGFLAIRVAGDAAALRPVLEASVKAAEPGLMFARWLTVQERIERGVRGERATVRLTAGFGLLATLLAGIGVFGSLGYLVTSRSHAIAVRLAVGAAPGMVWRGVVREALSLGLCGALGGVLLAWLMPLWMGAWLMAELRPSWFALGVSAAAGVLTALLGGLLPARRAAKIDPLVLLKAE